MVPVFFTFYIQGVLKFKKCSLFHNSNVFGSCIFHILYTGCAKIKKNAVCFIILTYLVPAFFTFYIQGVLKLKKCSLFHNSNVFGSCIFHILYTGCAKIKKISGAKRLIDFRGTTTVFVRSAQENALVMQNVKFLQCQIFLYKK